MGKKGKGKKPYAHHGKQAAPVASSGTAATGTAAPAAPPAPASRVPSRAQDIAQRRARHAWDTVKAAQDSGDPDAKDFGTHAKKLPMRIRAAGLGQALAFVRAKARPKGGEKTRAGLVLLLESTGGWVLPRLGVASESDRVDDAALLAAILEQDATFLRRATMETLAWLEWLNRFAEAEGLGDDHDDQD